MKISPDLDDKSQPELQDILRRERWKLAAWVLIAIAVTSAAWWLS